MQLIRPGLPCSRPESNDTTATRTHVATDSSVPKIPSPAAAVVQALLECAAGPVPPSPTTPAPPPSSRGRDAPAAWHLRRRRSVSCPTSPRAVRITQQPTANAQVPRIDRAAHHAETMGVMRVRSPSPPARPWSPRHHGGAVLHDGPCSMAAGVDSRLSWPVTHSSPSLTPSPPPPSSDLPPPPHSATAPGTPRRRASPAPITVTPWEGTGNEPMPPPPLPPSPRRPFAGPPPSPLPPLGLCAGVHANRNVVYQRTMEDTHAIHTPFLDTPGHGFFAVYDGHAGVDAAEWCQAHLANLVASLLRNPPVPYATVPEILDLAFVRADSLLAQVPVRSGCTAVACLVCTEAAGDRRVLYTANAGDARAVLCRKGQAVRLSYDHKGTDPFEARRIMDAGGFLLNHRVNGVLAVTRALGNASLKDLVIGNPYTTELELTGDDEFLILASDGIWDILSDQEAVNLVLPILDPNTAAKVLVQEALERQSMDNLTAIVVRFTHARRRPSHAPTPSALLAARSRSNSNMLAPTPTPAATNSSSNGSGAAPPWWTES
ncbi:Protein phosphatase 2C 1 [Allomyces arbusculus]|nr:Protein phosphatase 2C 1 [Allomyces arbusculus]